MRIWITEEAAEGKGECHGFRDHSHFEQRITRRVHLFHRNPHLAGLAKYRVMNDDRQNGSDKQR